MTRNRIAALVIAIGVVCILAGVGSGILAVAILGMPIIVGGILAIERG